MLEILDFIVRGLLLLFLTSAITSSILVGWVFYCETKRYYKIKKERINAN